MADGSLKAYFDLVPLLESGVIAKTEDGMISFTEAYASLFSTSKWTLGQNGLTTIYSHAFDPEEDDFNFPIVPGLIISRLSWHGWVADAQHLSRGRYKYGKSTASLDGNHADPSYKLCIKSPDLTCLRQMYRKIRVKKITPIENWDGVER